MTEFLHSIFPFVLDWPLVLLLLPLPWLIKPQSDAKLERPHTAPKLPMFSTIKMIGLGLTAKQEKNNRWQGIFLALAWLCLILALARPTYYGEPINIDLTGRDLMLAIDISPSMQEQDLSLNNQPANRLDVVKHVVSDFIKQRQGDRIGLILFGTTPYIQAPLTFDTDTVNTLLNEAYLGMAGQATAIGDAIALGVKRLRDRPENSRVLILLSDGANTAGEIPPEKAAQLASVENIKIYTIGIGADEMLKRSLFITQRVNPSADLDEKMLTSIALTTGGQYFRARDSQELELIYDEINKLEAIEQEGKTYRPSKAIYYWLLSIALVLYSILILAGLAKPLITSLNKSK